MIDAINTCNPHERNTFSRCSLHWAEGDQEGRLIMPRPKRRGKGWLVGGRWHLGGTRLGSSDGMGSSNAAGFGTQWSSAISGFSSRRRRSEAPAFLQTLPAAGKPQRSIHQSSAVGPVLTLSRRDRCIAITKGPFATWPCKWLPRWSEKDAAAYAWVNGLPCRTGRDALQGGPSDWATDPVGGRTPQFAHGRDRDRRWQTSRNNGPRRPERRRGAAALSLVRQGTW